MSKQRRITVRGIITRDNTLLAQQQKPGSDGLKRDYWCTPGGGLEPGESLHDGLIREMIEETGVTPVIGKLLFIQQYQDAEKEFLEFFFHITNTDDYDNIDLAATTHGELEVEEVDFVHPIKANVRPLFLQSINFATHVNEPREVQFINYLDEL